MWVFNFRRRLRRDDNAMEGQDFDLVSRTVNQAITDLAKLSERIGQLETERADILTRINHLEVENARLVRENKHLENVLRSYIQEKNPNIVK